MSSPSPASPVANAVRVAAAGAALDAFPVSPFHIALPAGAVPRRGLLRGLRSALGDAAAATAVLGDGAQASITRAWALHRARRAGGSAADYGETRRIGAARLALGRALPVARRAGRARSPRGVRAVAARVWAEARHVRGLRTGWRFARWLATGLRWWLCQRGGAAAAPVPRAGAPLGAEIMVLGVRAGAVFAASSRVAHGFDDGQIDVGQAPGIEAPAVVLCEAPDIEAPAVVLCEAPGIEAPAVALCEAPGVEAPAVVLCEAPGIEAPAVVLCEAPGIEAPAVVLCETPALAVPALDPGLDNPIGWVREVEPRIAALGSAASAARPGCARTAW